MIDTGGAPKRDHIEHEFERASFDDTYGEVERWLKVAYDLDA